MFGCFGKKKKKLKGKAPLDAKKDGQSLCSIEEHPDQQVSLTRVCATGMI